MSGQYVETGRKGFVNGGTALNRYLRVKLSSGVLALAGITDREIGVLGERVEASKHGDVILSSASGTTPMVASAAISAGALVYTAASGKIGASASTAYIVGTALEAATADGDVIEVLRNSHGDTAVS